MDEKTLVKKCTSGDARAQREIFDRYSSKMLGVIMRYFKDKSHAEDVLQDAFIKVFQKIHQFKNEGSLEGWIRRLVVNTALDQIRKNKKFIKDVELDDSYYEVVENSKVEAKMNADVLLQIIHQLPEGYRVIFNLYAIEGYKHKEIAEELGISENTSKSQYSRAKKLLREMLDKYEIER